MARNLARERREILVNDLEPEALGGVEDPEAELVGRECQLKVFHALRVARSRLGQHEWEVLRQRYDEELSAAKIGALHGVHRATVARWLESAYGVLEHEIRRYLAENHRTSQHEIDAMIERSMRRREWAHDPVLADAG
jgi:RNA polymerase sigma-70 factor (ECF subfamily)